MTLAPASSLLMSAALLGLALAATPARAGEGHDHGEAPAAAAGPALPRFVASSELFELVGVLQGRQLTLYLDHADSNAPVKDARLELELGGVKLSPTRHADGAFELTLAAAPKTGITPVTATVSTPGDSDLLAGELDIHDDAHAEAAPPPSWKERGLWVAAAVAAVFAIGLLVRRLGSGGRAARSGVAA